MRAGDQRPLADELSEKEREYLLGVDEQRAPGTVAILAWIVHHGTRTLDPGLLQMFRAAAPTVQPTVLAVSSVPLPALDEEPAFDDDGEELNEVDRSEELEILQTRTEPDLAWRLERHWIVEWSANVDQPPPPVLFVGSRGVFALATALPPRSRPALAALGAFPVVTADEVRAAATFVGGSPLTPADCSRILTYFEETHLLAAASPGVTAAYWQARGGKGRRPSRVFQCGSAAMAYDDVLPGLEPSTTTETAPALWQLDATGTPTGAALLLLRAWRAYAGTLRRRGLQTV